MSPRYRLAPAADRDIKAILLETARLIGPQQRATYAALIQTAIDLVAAQSDRLGTVGRDDLGRGLPSFHVAHAARRAGAASHTLFFEQGKMDDGAPGIVILRILHDHMDPERHIEIGQT